MKKILIIQTAFLGDVILATSVVETLINAIPTAHIDILVRSPHETILENNPYINSIITWDKRKNKFINLVKVILKIRKNKYDVLINIQRFLSTGIITIFSKATVTIGFKPNPLSWFFTHSVQHQLFNKEKLVHEIERNHQLVLKVGNFDLKNPKLYPSKLDFETMKKMSGNQPYICIAPCSVWFTKEFPLNKWVELIDILKQKNGYIYVVGSLQDVSFAEKIIAEVKSKKVVNLCGKIKLLEVAALMQGAAMNYVNDSAPLHIASSMNAPVKAFFLSTVPNFGFYPLSEQASIISLPLSCKPCTNHGRPHCPQKHFDCAQKIKITEALI